METATNRYKNKILTIPNMLSFFRLCLIPVIVWLYMVKKDALWTTAVLVLSGVTDIVDGIIARKCHMISDFGKAFDPVADKLTQIAVLFCLVTQFPYMLVPLAVLVVKELFAIVVNLIIIRRTGDVHGAVWHGKVTTALLYSTMGIHLLWVNIPAVVSCVLIGVCTVMILLSGILYSIQNIGYLKDSKNATGRE